MVRTRGKDGSVLRCGNIRCGVSTSMHGHLAIELGNIPYSSSFPITDGQKSIPHPSTLSSSFPSSSTPSSSSEQHPFDRSSLLCTTSVPPIVVKEHVLPRPMFNHPPSHMPTLHATTAPLPIVTPHPGPPVQSYSSVHTTHAPSVHANHASSIQRTHAPSLHTSSIPPVHTTFDPSPVPIHEVSVHPIVVSTNHDLPHEEVQRDANGRVIIRLMDKGYAIFFIHIVIYG